jgi:hypothetical protein
MTMKARMQVLARRVVRGHTEYDDERLTSFDRLRDTGAKACPDCGNGLHADQSLAGGEQGLQLYVCGVCGGSWILAPRH